MTNEKTNPMPYRAEDAAALLAASGASDPALPDMAAPVITPDDVARGTELLRRYKDGKRALEARIIADEQWYRLRHWQYLRDRRREQGADVVEPTSAWLFNAIVSKHADAMDSFPEAVILPRSEQDEPDAKALSAIVPAVLEKTHFEQVWSDAWWYKLKHGCAAYGVFWDSAGSNGLGDVAVRQLDLLNLFWEPGITDIQASRNLFVCALMDNDDISAAWPDARPGSCGVELAQYLYDDAVDTSNKSIVVDWYYKKPLPGGGTALHLIKFTGRDLLYASENDPAMAGGFYPHGQYPVVFDVLYPEAGTPCGFGMIAVSKDPQQYIDRLSGNLLEMSMKASTPRFWVKKGCGVNAQEFLDWSKPLVEVEGSIDDERLRQISLYNLDGQWVNMLQLKIDELKDRIGVKKTIKDYGVDEKDFLDRLDPNLAVSNGTGASSVADDLDNAIDMLIGANKGELYLRDRVDKQLVATHVFLPAMLRTAALHLVDSHTANISSKQRVLKNLKLLGTNNRRNLLHSKFLSSIKEMN